MTTFCISDTHLADRGPRDNFMVGDRLESLYRFLGYVKRQDGRLLILGDLFEWWQVSIGTSVKAYLPLLDRLAAMEARWVFGNHDSALSRLEGYSDLMPQHFLFRNATGPFCESIGGRKFLFMHGHEADPYCRDENPGIGHLTAILSGRHEDRNRSPIDRNGRIIEDSLVGFLEGAVTVWRKLTFRPSRLAELIDGVEEYRRKRLADVVVYGHTHMPGRIGNYHYNCGTWASWENTFVRIADNGAVRVRLWNGDMSVPFTKKLRC